MKALLSSARSLYPHGLRVLLLLLPGMALLACTAPQERYVPLGDRVIIEPTTVDGRKELPLDDWLHNFKIRVLPKICSNPDSGFRKLYQGPLEDCEREAEDMMDRCMSGPMRQSLPDTITTAMEANNAGTFLGVCVLSAYGEKLKVEGKLPAEESVE